MNEQQNKAVEMALNGHNLLLLGSAGTGKSFTIQKIAELMGERGKNVQITCSTGIACTVYSRKFKVCTVHKFLGLGDGRYGPAEISQIIKNSPKYDYVLHNLRDLDCLIVDECSMVSARTFEIINAVCQLKNQELKFGGIQVIFCGDFYQLPPVANTLYQDTGRYCFESEIFTDIFVHRVILSNNTRTDDERLVRTIHEVFSGRVSNESEDLLKSLKRPLPDACKSIKLFPKNDRVDDYNRSCLLDFHGQMYEFKAVDTGTISALDKVTAQKTLWLKEGCPVILLQNMTDELVNGLTGRVSSLRNGPVVEFDNGMTRSIPKAKFSVFSPLVNKDIATREQYPLKPAFGLTIHKAQGMTLDSVEVDCKDIFMSGQLGVALSRARSSEGLRVINYHPRYVMNPAKIVTDYMKMSSLETQPDLCCCRNETGHTKFETDTGTSDPLTTQHPGGSTSEIRETSYMTAQSVSVTAEAEQEDIDEIVEDEFDIIVASITRNEESALEFAFPEGFDYEKLKESLKVEKVVTSTQENINRILSKLDDSSLQLFAKKLLLKLGELVSTISDSDVPKGIPEKNLNKFLHLLHSYSVSAEYQMNSLLLFQKEISFTDEHKIICFKVLEYVKLFYIKKKVDLLQVTSCRVSRRYVTNSSRARIRYVAGYCVAKLRTKYSKMQKANMYSNSKEAQHSYSEAKDKVKLLSLLKEDEHFLKENTSEPDSLVDVERKQNITHGLTNVTDSLFNFFVDLTEISLKHLTNEKLLEHGKNLYSESYTYILDDNHLFERFVSVVVKRITDEKLEELTVHKYENMDLSEHVSTVTDELVLQAALINSLFKEIVEKYLHVLFAQFRKDVKSASKIEKKMAHRKQVKVAKGSKGPASKKVVSAPQVSTESTQSPQSQIITTESATMATVSEASGFEPVPGTSAETEDTELCKKCMTNRPDEWIQCDSCSGWLHRKCAGLSNTRQWKMFTKEAAQWFCKDCK